MKIKFVFKDEVVEQDIEQDTLIQIKLLKGEPGANGSSPTITTTQTQSGYDITIIDINGTRTISIENGRDGAKGEQRKSRNTRKWNNKYNQNRYEWIDRYLHHNIYKWRY